MYVLVTAAYNEADYIEATLRSVVAQTVLPQAWVIVSDGSTDGTDDIVRGYAERHPFVKLVRLERSTGRSFVSKVYAVQAGFKALAEMPFDFVGNIDADISMEPTYFERLLRKFSADQLLGIGGGWIHEETGGRFLPRAHNSRQWVPHAVQLLRRSCYEAIGGYVPLPYGGEDTCAVVTARMKGWNAESFADLPVHHHRETSTAGGVLRNRFRGGRLDYSIGYHPLYELLKCARRSVEAPAIVGAGAALAGFFTGYLRGEPRPVSDEFVGFIRQTQSQRLLRR